MTKAKRTQAEQQAARKRSRRTEGLVALALIVFFFVCACGIVVTLLIPDNQVADSPVVQEDPNNATLTLAYTPDKAELVRTLVDRFNAQNLRTDDRQAMQVQLVELTPDAMIEEALAGPSFQAMSPDSSLWIDQLDRRWGQAQQAEAGAIASSLIGESVRFAVSPVVIAAWEMCIRDSSL